MASGTSGGVWRGRCASRAGCGWSCTAAVGRGRRNARSSPSARSATSALVVLTNTHSGRFVHDAVYEWWLRTVLETSPAPPPQPVAAGRDLLDTYAGRYTSPGNEITISVEGDRLLMAEAPKVRLARRYDVEPPVHSPATLGYVGDDRVTFLDGPMRGAPGEFLRDADGAIDWLRIHGSGRLHRRLPSH